MVQVSGWGLGVSRASSPTPTPSSRSRCTPPDGEKWFFNDNLLVRIRSIIEMILVDRPCAMEEFHSHLMEAFVLAFGVEGMGTGNIRRG